MSDVPYGYCHCGCGERTRLASKTATGAGHIKGQPLRFVHGHNGRAKNAYYVVEDRGYATPCWVWQGTTNGKGYGLVKTTAGKMYAHRMHWARVHGPVPRGLELDHLCRVKLCCRPDHLEAVTHAENMRRGKVAKLTMDDARAIRRSAESAKALAAVYGVSVGTIRQIRWGLTWREDT